MWSFTSRPHILQSKHRKISNLNMAACRAVFWGVGEGRSTPTYSDQIWVVRLEIKPKHCSPNHRNNIRVTIFQYNDNYSAPYLGGTSMGTVTVISQWRTCNREVSSFFLCGENPVGEMEPGNVHWIQDTGFQTAALEVRTILRVYIYLYIINSMCICMLVRYILILW